MRKPKKLVLMVFATIESAKLRFFLIYHLNYQGPIQSILRLFQPTILTNTIAMTAITILTKMFTTSSYM